jgi:hypothetical protein
LTADITTVDAFLSGATDTIPCASGTSLNIFSCSKFEACLISSNIGGFAFDRADLSSDDEDYQDLHDHESDESYDPIVESENTFSGAQIEVPFNRIPHTLFCHFYHTHAFKSHVFFPRLYLEQRRNKTLR